MPITLKRAYEPPAETDGLRVLVERLWPRGVSKEDARIDLWAKEVAPSTELRRWFGHDPEKWSEPDSPVPRSGGVPSRCWALDCGWVAERRPERGAER